LSDQAFDLCVTMPILPCNAVAIEVPEWTIESSHGPLAETPAIRLSPAPSSYGS
jgi:hypothetical protein